jgi:xanthine dehydrogenase accessory factor
MDPHLLKKLNAARRARQAAVMITDLGDGRDRLVHAGGSDRRGARRGGHKGSVFGKSGAVEAEGRRFFLNVHVPAPRMVIIGAVHISQVLAPMAMMTGL